MMQYGAVRSSLLSHFKRWDPAFLINTQRLQPEIAALKAAFDEKRMRELADSFYLTPELMQLIRKRTRAKSIASMNYDELALFIALATESPESMATQRAIIEAEHDKLVARTEAWLAVLNTLVESKSLKPEEENAQGSTD